MASADVVVVAEAVIVGQNRVEFRETAQLSLVTTAKNTGRPRVTSPFSFPENLFRNTGKQRPLQLKRLPRHPKPKAWRLPTLSRRTSPSSQIRRTVVSSLLGGNR